MRLGQIVRHPLAGALDSRLYTELVVVVRLGVTNAVCLLPWLQLRSQKNWVRTIFVFNQWK